MKTVSFTASALVLALVHTATAGANPAQAPPRRPRVGLALGGGSGGNLRVYFLAGKVVR